MNYLLKALLLSAAILISTAHAVPPGQSNLLANGSFEFWSMSSKVYAQHAKGFDGNQRLVPVRWDIAGAIERSQDAHGGKFSVSAPAGGTEMVLGLLECNPGSTYSYGVWAKGKGKVAVAVYSEALDGWHRIGDTTEQASDKWTLIGGQVKIPMHLRMVKIVVSAQNGNEQLLLDDAHIACDPGFAYDADAFLKPFKPDKNTLLLASFENMDGLSFTNRNSKASLIDGGRFGKALRLERDDLALMTIPATKMPPEGTLEVWISPEQPGQHLTLSGGGQRIIEMGGGLSFAVTIDNSRDRAYLGWRNLLLNQQQWPGEFTHMALTWGPDGLRSYVNGSLACFVAQQPTYSLVPTNIEFGAKLSHAGCSEVLDEFRLSDLRRYGVVAPKGDKIVKLPDAEVIPPPAPPAANKFDIDTIQKEIAKLVTPLAFTDGKFENQHNDKGQYIYDAASIKPLITHTRLDHLADTKYKGMNVTWLPSSRGWAEAPDINGAYWKLGAIKPGRYWVSVLGTEFPAIFLNGRLVQATSACDPVQVRDDCWMSELQVDVPLDLKPGDEIALQYFGGTPYVARLILNSARPEPGRRPAPLNLGGSESIIYSAHGLAAVPLWQDKDAKAMPGLKGFRSLEQNTGVPANIRKGPDGRPVVALLICNPLPVAVKANVQCLIQSYYRIPVGSHKEQIVLEPHQSVERLIPFDPIADEPGYTATSRIQALDRPELNWPEGDTISIFQGFRQTIAWPDPCAHNMLRPLVFTEPIQSVRQVLVLNGRWEKAYTPDYKVVPPAADLKWEPTNVPLNWYFNSIMSQMKPRAHSMYVRRKFTIPPEAANRTYRLIITELWDAADAWINGVYVGQLLGGNTPMVADATKGIKVGENEIVVQVRDILPLMNQAYVNPAKPEGSAFYLDIPGFFSGNGVGIDDVFIETSPIVAADELMALPSYRDKKLATRFHLINHRTTPAKVRVKTHVLAEGKSVLTIDERELTLEPNKLVPMAFEKSWKDARLWGPEDPYLYVLAVETFDIASGERIDIARVRFGFRECWIDGGKIMLNGVAIRPMNAYTRGRQAPIMIRMPGLDYFDETGRMSLKYITQMTNSASRHNLERDAYWENAKKNALIHLKRFVNHPSIIAWDLSNEWLCFLDYYSPDPMLGPKRFKNVSDHVRAFDPTRWNTFNGEGDLHGLHDNHCFHYMIAWHGMEKVTGHNRFYPDSEWWRPLNKHFTPGQDILMNPFSRVILRPDKKVILDSEYLWKVSETMPPHMTEVCDEDDVLGAAVDSFSGPALWHWMNKVEGHRDLGVHWTHTYRLPGIAARAFEPKTFLMPELDHNAFAGRKFVRLYTMMNDGPRPADIELRWELLAPDGKTVLQGKDAIPGMKTGYNHRGQIELVMPQVAERTLYTLRARMYDGGKFCFGRELDIDVWPDQPILTGHLQRRLALYDPTGKTAKVLDMIGAKYDKVNSLLDPLAEPAKTTLIVGEEAIDASATGATLKVLDFVKAGGHALFLQQTIGPMGLPAPSKIDKMQWASLCFNRMPIHPVVQGLTNWDLSFWGVNHAAAKGSYDKPNHGPFLTIIDSGYFNGLEYVNLMEQYVGSGAYLLCQLPVIQKYDEEPMAREMLARLIRYAGGSDVFLKTISTLQAAITNNGPTAMRLDDVGAEYQLVKLDTPLDPKRPLLAEAQTLRAATHAQRANLAAYLQAGGTAAITCPTPEDAAWISQLAGKEVKFSVQKYITWHGRAMRTGHSPFTAGLSHQDLYWKQYDPSEQAGSQSDNFKLAIEQLQDYSVSVSGARELVWPGAMLELKIGSGTLIIDQRRWTTSAGDLAKHSFRNASALLLGLGVKLAPAMPQRQLPKEIDYRTIDLTQFANRSLIDEKSEDGEGGWSDQGAGADLRSFTTGKINLQGVPFVVGEHPKSCIVLASSSRPGYDKMPKEVSIPIGYAVEGFFFLHGFAYTADNALTSGVYQIVYADGTTFDIALKGNVNCRDWAGGPASSFAREKDTISSIAWTGSCEMFPVIAVYKMLWVNPRPDVEVKAIRHYKTRDMSGVPVLMGVTSVLKREFQALTEAQTQQVRQLVAQSDQALKAKDLAAAEKLLRQALAIDPRQWEAFQKLADILEQKGNEDEQLEHYMTWVHNGSITPLPFNRIAEILEKRKDLRGAIEFYTRSLTVNWNQPPVIESKKRLEAMIRE